MGSTHWRTGAVAAIAVGLAVAGAPTATGLPVQDVRQGTEFSCFTSSEEVYVELGAFFPEAGELTETWAAVYTEEFQSFAFEGEGTLDGDDFTLSYSLANDAGAAVGTMSVEGNVTPLGEPSTVNERFRDGNAWSAVEGAVQGLLVSANIASATGDLAALTGTELSCSGAALDLVYSGTTPATRIYRSASASAQCAIGENGFLSVDRFGEEAFVSLALGVDWEEGTIEFGATGTVSASRNTITGTVDAYQPVTDPPQTVAVDLTVGRVLENGRFRDKGRHGAFFMRFTDYALSGTVRLPDGSVVAIEDCVLQEVTAVDRFSSRAGQKPGGRPPANDAPSAAIALDAGATITTSTRGAAEAPEAPCLVDGEFDVPFGRTVWYSVEGTGDNVTLTTAGSDFDTVIGVYDADTQENVACVDDTAEGLQASVTYSTTAGTTYLVQVGGFGEGWGTLVLTRS
jgi:hypothetical protein